MHRSGLKNQSLRMCLLVALTLTLISPGESPGQNYSRDDVAGEQPDVIGPVLPGREPAKQNGASEGRQDVLDWETGRGRSYVMPAAEVLT